ncbi:flavin-containing monooxygenase FMO GS-OX-like 4 isoform X2 [Seriola dumerili]|uniref:flavin-containing monooxygenase FMO GS-OX-like 4 isoform X2 n=1 Tax=Seriola dumerili TaxID=41447 RepID=UPI000BBE464E|nr:flavin-containing monooxygenase FMO GS-OX-like 4 isoform X2 [Seriola dumerili]
MALQRVAVIGAGAAGLCAARHILSRPNSFARPVVFELTDNIGGTWCYDERVGNYDNGRPVHSSMYRDLRTNLPKEVMMFPDFPFDPQLSSFLPHQEVQRYLERYCHSHNIRPHIRFNTAVENVRPVVEEETTTWEVTSCDSSGGQKTETFDSVFVCSGHYSDPHIPDIPGVENFKGEVLHSHSYRYAEPFSGQSVVVLGAKASGLDISIELAKVGAQVTLSHGRPRLTFPLPSGIQQSSPVVAVQDDGSVRFQDGSVGRADVLMFCTGYNFRYTFLDADQLSLEIQDHMVSPLYRFLTPPAFPSLFFIGICKIICPFPNFDCQVLKTWLLPQLSICQESNVRISPVQCQGQFRP